MTDEALKQTGAAENSFGSSLAEKLKQKKALQKKKKRLLFIVLIVAFVFAYGIYWLFKPLKGGLPYGICKTFLELNVPYPDTVTLSQVLTLRDGSLRIWFTHIDAFGEYKMEPFQCTFKDDEKTGNRILASVQLGKIDVDPKSVENFNLIIPYLVAHPPDLTLPYPIPSSLSGLQIDSNFFRKRLRLAK